MNKGIADGMVTGFCRGSEGCNTLVLGILKPKLETLSPKL